MSDFHLPSFSSLIFWKVSHFSEFQIFPSLQFSSLINFDVEPKSKPSTKMTNQKYVVQDTRPKVKQQRQDGEMVTIERIHDGGGGRSLLPPHQRQSTPSHYLQNIPGLNMNLAANDPNVRTIKQHYYPEGGWGWITIAVASFVHFMTANFFPSPGLLSIQVMDTFNPDQGIVAAGNKILLPSINSLSPFSVLSQSFQCAFSLSPFSVLSFSIRSVCFLFQSVQCAFFFNPFSVTVNRVQVTTQHAGLCDSNASNEWYKLLLASFLL